ncbi:MAG: ParB/RepB/Spo0J family partition protein [Firmicutes bacterium]|nr:ParB/RepB/Spo0J family partition protein [Bacillota bacterium]
MKLEAVNISDCNPFEDYPFRVVDDSEMEMLTESIKTYGVMCPIMVRPIDEYETKYEVISGHRRIYASIKAGLETIPAFIRQMNRDQAVICMVDSNLHRDRLLPSERAYAYKMKVEALSHQGKTSVQNEQKITSREMVAASAGMSESQVQRFIRLTYLHKPLLDLVDDGRIALTPAVALSYLNPWEQRTILQIYESDEITPSYSQAVRLKKLSETGELTDEKIYEILSEPKPNQREVLRLPMNRFDQYLKPFTTPKDKEDFIMKALDHYTCYLRQQRSWDR